MDSTHLRGLPGLVILFAFLTVPHARANDPVKDLEKRVTEHTLKNGMKLLVLERHAAPLVCIRGAAVLQRLRSDRKLR